MPGLPWCLWIDSPFFEHAKGGNWDNPLMGTGGLLSPSVPVHSCPASILTQPSTVLPPISLDPLLKVLVEVPAGFDATHSVKGEKARKKGNQISVLGRCSGTGHRPVMVPMSWAASCPERAAVWPSLGQEGMSSGRRNLTGGGLSLSIPAAMGWGPQGVGVRNTSL